MGSQCNHPHLTGVQLRQGHQEEEAAAMPTTIGSEERQMMNGDMRARALEIHWPPEFSPDDADVFAHHEVFIKAPVSTVWRHLVEAEKWPLLYPNAHDVRILNNSGGVLQEGVRFAWTTFGLAIQ